MEEKTPAVENKMYGGKVTIKFFPDSHIYYVNGKRKGSVTGALSIIDKSRALIPWAVDLYSDFLRGNLGKLLTEEMIIEGEDLWNVRKKEAANIGTTAHDWIDQFVKGQNPEMPEDKNVARAILGFLDWVEEHEVKFMEAEKVVYSKKHDYIGTLDAIATFGNGRRKYIIDYKVSNGLYPSVALQTAAYWKADEEESGTKYAGRWAIRLSKETEKEYDSRQAKKLAKYMLKNPDKSPYQIAPYQPFEARQLDGDTLKIDRDFKAFTHALELASIYGEVDKEFYNNR